MKGSALPVRRKKTSGGRVRFFKVNHINYNYYDHYSLSVSRLYRRVM